MLNPAALILGDGVLQVGEVFLGPLVPETVIPPTAPCPALVNRTDLESVSLYEVLERKYGSHADCTQEVVEAVNVGTEEAEFLKVAPGSALFRIRRLTTAKDHGPFEYVESLYCGNKYSLEISTQRPRRGSSFIP